ncbi:MAG: methionine--tRNA ligase [Candidatus Micrarchaeota archaeon]|nr:methionine--tRNA ligase [Candidatus Micrarchaeota archaeon]MDE1847801.1 methionine--tRNA ligase [Candidatus Micrarchaeota archaeon]MDE1864239.1 methionine--tRNA ligase [Candidatus Micrarchaeota archaeon]
MEGAKKYYITTAIPYVNAAPHIGHALEFAQADALANYRRMRGEEVFLTTGADENSLKNVRAAEKLGIGVEELCKRNSAAFREMAEGIGLKFDAFIRSSIKQEHWQGPMMLWELCNENGDIYTKKYRGIYCVACELFYTEDELVNGLCPEHGIKPEIVEEENYFFRLSKYQKRLEQLLESGELQILPQSRKNEMLGFIKEGLEDFSISRSNNRAKGWGVPVPGDDSQKMYVWFDALCIYLTGVGFGGDEAKFNRWWPAEMHVIGKGITRFHAIYWPAMLMSAGLKLPKTLFVHGYVTVEGQKMSKTAGNVLDPMMLINKYGRERLRYYLLKEIPTFEDGDLSEEGLVRVVNNELVSNLGNFIHRTLTFAHGNFEGAVDGAELEPKEKEMMDGIYKMVGQADLLFEEGRIRDAIVKILEIGNEANKYFQNSAPWELVKKDREATMKILFVCCNICRIISNMLYPFLPMASMELLGFVGAKVVPFDELKNLQKSFKIEKPRIVFDKIREEGAR